jgi:hypothetical protein
MTPLRIGVRCSTRTGRGISSPQVRGAGMLPSGAKRLRSAPCNVERMSLAYVFSRGRTSKCQGVPQHRHRQSWSRHRAKSVNSEHAGRGSSQHRSTCATSSIARSLGAAIRDAHREKVERPEAGRRQRNRARFGGESITGSSNRQRRGETTNYDAREARSSRRATAEGKPCELGCRK